MSGLSYKKPRVFREIIEADTKKSCFNFFFLEFSGIFLKGKLAFLLEKAWK